MNFTLHKEHPFQCTEVIEESEEQSLMGLSKKWNAHKHKREEKPANMVAYFCSLGTVLFLYKSGKTL